MQSMLEVTVTDIEINYLCTDVINDSIAKIGSNEGHIL